VATVITFSGVLSNDWTFTDDPLYVFQNPYVMHGLTMAGTRWAFHGPHGGNWHPLTSLVHMATVSLFGLRPAGHHAVSLVLHTLNAVLATLVLQAYTRAWWPSVLAAALFALHPLRVESVAWVAELKDVLAGAFFLLTLLAYRSWVANPGRIRFTWLVTSFGFALMAKPMVITLPLVLLLLDAWPLGRLKGNVRQRVLEKWPLFLLAAAEALVTWNVQRQVGAMAPLAVGLGSRIGNAIVSPWRYLGKTLWPHGMAFLYPVQPLAGWTIALALIGLVAVSAIAWIRRRTEPYVAVGWLWYLVMLIPVLGIIQVGQQAYADRYTYLPILGPLIAVCWGVADLVASRPVARRAAAVIALGLLAALAFVTTRQVTVWRNSRTLYEHALAVTADNAMVECSLGQALVQAGEVPEGIAHLERSLELKPGYDYAEFDLGVALLHAGRAADAIPHLESALTTLASSWTRDVLGVAYAGVGRLDDAERQFQEAARLDPRSTGALFHLGQVFHALGRDEEAEEQLTRAVSMDPGAVEPRRLLAQTLLSEGKAADALSQYERIVEMAPQDSDALSRVEQLRRSLAPAPR
jgi:protein O-mannosyl-transferase